MAIARGEQPTGTVEGIYALNGLIARGDSLGIEMPILKEMKHKLKI